MMTRIFMILTLCLAFTITTYPQDNQLVYGETVSGEITYERPAITYTFEGSAGDVIIAEMFSVNRELDNPLETPVLRLRAPNEALLVDTSLSFLLDDTFLIAQLPTEGVYQLTAARDETVSVLATGKFTLTVQLIPELTIEAPFEGVITNDEFGQYVYVQPETDFRIAYTRTSGDFAPQVTVNQLTTERNGLEAIAQASGDGLTEALLGVFPAEEDAVYIVQLSQALFDFYFEDVEAAYELRVVPEEQPE